MRTRTKLLFIVPTMGYGGTERQIIELCRGLPREKFDIDLLVIKDAPGYLDEPYPIPANIIRLQLSHWFYFGALPRFIRILNDGHYDIIHSFLPIANFWSGMALRFFPKKPVFIGSSRNIDYPPPRWLYRFLDRMAFTQWCDVVLSNSDWGKQVMHDVFKIPKNKIGVICNGLNMEKFCQPPGPAFLWREQNGIPSRGPLVATIGRLSEQKGMRFFIEMAALMARKNQEIQFLLVGSGPEYGFIKTQVRKNNLDKRMRLWGRRQDVPNILHASSIFVLPSLYEGCPNVLLEALATRVPVVATDIPPHREFLGNREHALLVPCARPEAMAAAAEELLSNPEEAKNMAERGRRCVLKRFSLDQMIKNHIHLYESALKDGDVNPLDSILISSAGAT